MIQGKLSTSIERRGMTRHPVRNHPGFCWEIDCGAKRGLSFTTKNRKRVRRWYRRRERQRDPFHEA